MLMMIAADEVAVLDLEMLNIRMPSARPQI